MVFSLCYRLISLEDQTTNSECMKTPSSLYPPETIKMLPICLVLFTLCRLTSPPSDTLAGVLRCLPWEYSLHLLIIVKEAHVSWNCFVNPHLFHGSLAKKTKLKSAIRCRLRSDCCVRRSVVSH